MRKRSVFRCVVMMLLGLMPAASAEAYEFSGVTRASLPGGATPSPHGQPEGSQAFIQSQGGTVAAWTADFEAGASAPGLRRCQQPDPGHHSASGCGRPLFDINEHTPDVRANTAPPGVGAYAIWATAMTRSPGRISRRWAASCSCATLPPGDGGAGLPAPRHPQRPHHRGHAGVWAPALRTPALNKVFIPSLSARSAGAAAAHQPGQQARRRLNQQDKFVMKGRTKRSQPRAVLMSFSSSETKVFEASQQVRRQPAHPAAGKTSM